MNNQQSDITAFLQEIIARFQQKSPKFFKVWGWINKIMLLLAGIPTLLNWIQQVFEVDMNAVLPGYGLRVILKIVSFAAAWGLFMNKLTVKSPHDVVVDNGVILQKPCSDLPFSEKKEEASIIETK